MDERDFHITIGTASHKAFDLENDLRMLRAALLYADRVRLYSYTTSQVLSFFVQSKSLNHFLDYSERVIIPTLNPQDRTRQLDKINSYRRLLRKKYRDRDEIQALDAFRKQFAEHKSSLRTQYPAITREKDLKGIEKAIRSRMLDVHTFESLREETLVAKHYAGDSIGDASEFVEEFLNIVSNAIADAKTYPLFDDTTGILVKDRIADGRMAASAAGIGQARHSALAANYLQRLPVFDETPIDEILDIRKDLSQYLTRFRSGISTYATKIMSASWDKDFPGEADEIFIREVKPSILDIEEKVKASSYLVTMIARKAVDAKSLVSGSALSLFVERLDLLPMFTSIGLGFAVPIAIAIYDAFKARQKEKQDIEKHNLYFYYRAGKRLSE